MPTKTALSLAVSFLLLVSTTINSPLAVANEWHELKGTHFLIYTQTGVDSSLTQTVMFNAEQSYDRIIRYFGALPQKGFWLWDNRCKIYLFESQKGYLAYSKQPEWSGGVSIPSRRTIISYQNAPNFLESVLPHELGHLIFREFVGFQNGQIPRWLDEGFAVWQEEGDKEHYRAVVAKAAQEGTTIRLTTLNQMSLLHEQKTRDAELFYSQSQSMVRFLLENRDPSYFINFCRSLRDGVDFEEALRKNYKYDFATLNELEASWKRYVFEQHVIK